MMTNLVACLIVTNAMRAYCPYCDTGDGSMLTVLHDHKIEYVVTTNYLPVIVVPEEGRTEPPRQGADGRLP